MNIFKGLYEEIDQIVDAKKQAVIWGYERSGLFLERLLAEKFGKKAEYIIDNGYCKICKQDINHPIYSDGIIEYLDPKETNVYLTMMNGSADAVEKLKVRGFEEGVNVFQMRNGRLGSYNSSGLTYEGYLQFVLGMDFIDTISPGLSKLECNEDSHGYSSVNVFDLIRLFSEVDDVENRALFDYGCGKAKTVLIALEAGFRRAGGIEMNQYLYETACLNMKKLNAITPCEAELICGNAAEYDKIDDYDVFYFYSPFKGETFQKTMAQIEASYNRNKRKITIIYTNPRCHKDVVASGLFQLKKQLAIETKYPVGNIYETVDL